MVKGGEWGEHIKNKLRSRSGTAQSAQSADKTGEKDQKKEKRKRGKELRVTAQNGGKKSEARVPRK